MLDFIRQPWPWWVSGPLIGLIAPLLLILGNKMFGLSSSLRHICAAVAPANIPFFKYDWKKEAWNLFFVGGIAIGAFIATRWLVSSGIVINSKLVSELSGYGITNTQRYVPAEIVGWNTLFTVKGIILTVVGGFLVGFGTRYANGCTSGHAITGLSTLQWPSLVATMSFFAGGMLMANYILPCILKL